MHEAFIITPTSRKWCSGREQKEGLEIKAIVYICVVYDVKFCYNSEKYINSQLLGDHSLKDPKNK